jgi:hypothetical protein
MPTAPRASSSVPDGTGLDADRADSQMPPTLTRATGPATDRRRSPGSEPGPGWRHGSGWTSSCSTPLVSATPHVTDLAADRISRDRQHKSHPASEMYGLRDLRSGDLRSRQPVAHGFTGCGYCRPLPGPLRTAPVVVGCARW